MYRIGGILLAFFVILLGLSYLTRASFVRISGVSVQGNKIVQREAIEADVQAALSTSILKIFSRNNFALFPRAAAEQKILADYATIQNVALSFKGLRNISVQVKEYEPAYLWCDSLVRKHCYFMNPHGYVFTQAADFSQNVLFTFYGLINSDAPIGQTYLPTEQFASVNGFVENLKTFKLSPVGVNARGNGNNDFEVLLSSGGRIVFSNHEDLQTTLENVEAIFDRQTKADSNFLQKLDYVDVRFTSKAFVKMKEVPVL